MKEHITFDRPDALLQDLIDLDIAAVVTAQSDIQVLTTADINGHEIDEPYDTAWKEVMQERLETMASFASLARPEAYTKPELAEALGATLPQTEGIIRALSRALPPEVFWVGELDTTPKTRSVKIGTFVVASSIIPATEADIEAKKFRKTEHPEHRALRRAAEQADREKFQLTAYDHAVVAVGDTRLHLPFDAVEGFLAARILGQLPKYATNHQTIPKTELTHSVWHSMSLAERKLFTECLSSSDKAYRMYDDTAGEVVIGHKVREMIEDVLCKPAGGREPLMTPVRFAKDSYYATNMPLRLQLKLTPGTEDDLPTLRPVPHQHSRPLEVTPAHLEVADEIVTMLPQLSRGINHVLAIEILETVMRPEGRAALRMVIKEKGSSKTGEEVFQLLHERVRRSLGEDAYWEAVKQRA